MCIMAKKSNKNPWKETEEMRKFRIENEGKQIVKSWSKHGDKKNHKKNRRDTKKELKNYKDF